MAEHPYFFWDYDITEEEIREILRGDNAVEKAWVISRILQYAKWEDIWKYLKLENVRAHFDRLHFRTPYFRDLWAYALDLWDRSDE